MNEFRPQTKISPEASGWRWGWWLAGGCVVILLLATLGHRPGVDPTDSENSAHASSPGVNHKFTTTSPVRATHPASARPPAATAGEIVAGKLVQFGKARRQLVYALAQHFKMDVPADVERFFDAVEGGRWEEIEAAHTALLSPGQGLNQPRSDELHHIWRAIQETWGTAREAHDWPAQKLLDYGDSILGSLRPGMVYVGGTDPGCFIPAFLNETSEGERHVTLTQNALADSTYLDYLNFLYGDRMKTLTPDDSQHSFQDYLADAKKRAQHDQQFPDEPKQIRTGEEVVLDGNAVRVSGQVAVMSINERLFQTLMQKNPDLTFAMEESFPFMSTYSNAAPLGPILELGVQDPQNGLTAERAAQSVDYWRQTAQQLLADPETPAESDPRKAYAKMVAAQAALLLNRNYPSESEQAFRMANDLFPANPDAVTGLVNLLVSQKRSEEAIPIVQNALQANPKEKQFTDLLNRLQAGK